jgi:hypothetical protein
MENLLPAEPAKQAAAGSDIGALIADEVHVIITQCTFASFAYVLHYARLYVRNPAAPQSFLLRMT